MNAVPITASMPRREPIFSQAKVMEHQAKIRPRSSRNNPALPPDANNLITLLQQREPAVPAQLPPPLPKEEPALATAPPAIPEGLTPEEQAEFLRLQGQAYNLRHRTAAVYLQAVMRSVMPENALPALATYVTQLLKDAGDPTDPVERMMIEQIALAHHNIGQLYVRAAVATNADQVQVYYAAAARLTSEFRRLALAWKAYREPTPAKNVVLVEQQNVAQHQQIAYVQGESVGQPTADSPQKGTRKRIRTQPTGK
jgi:hypothetical protein